MSSIGKPQPRPGASAASPIEGRRDRLELDPRAGASPTASTSLELDAFQAGPGQHALLARQRDELVNAADIRPEVAPTEASKELLGQLEEHVAVAVGALSSGEQPTSLVHRAIADYSAGVAQSYGIFGRVEAATPEQLAAAKARGLSAGTAEVVVAVRQGGATDRAETRRGVVVMAVDPRQLLSPVVVTLRDGTRQHSFTSAREVPPVRGFVLEYPDSPFGRLRAMEAEARDAAVAVWSHPTPAERAAALDELGVRLAAFEKALESAQLAGHQAVSMRGALNALRSLQRITAQHLDS